MSTKPSKTVIEAVNRAYSPLDVGRAMRNAVINAAWLVVLVFAALSLSGPLSWALWALVAWRAFGFLLLPLVGRVDNEKRRRLALLPQPYRALMTTGEVTR